LDPRYAAAWSALSTNWMGLGGTYLGGKAQQDAFAQSRKAADTALALAPDLPAAHRARGVVLLYLESDWVGAEAEFRRGLQLDPGNIALKSSLATVLAVLGHLDQAIDLNRQLLVIDPLHADFYADLASYLMPLGRLDEAEQAIRKAVELQPSASNH